MTPIELVLSRLPEARRAGARWIARCPAHPDRRPSLQVGEGRDGAVLVKCWAGCDLDDILRALGLERRDLFVRQAMGAPRTDQTRPRPRPRSPLDEARAAVLREARSQLWMRPGVVEGYRRADWLRVHERLVEQGRQRVTALGDCPEAWELAALCAELQREVWALEADPTDSLWTALLCDDGVGTPAAYQAATQPDRPAAVQHRSRRRRTFTVEVWP